MSHATFRLARRLGPASRVAAVLALSLGQVPLSYAGAEILGRLDIGVSAISNTGGHASTVMSSGITTPSFFALRGSEDLADGTRALFYLQMNYQVDDGAQPLAVPAFSSAAYVGLAGPAWGTLALGRQKDFTLDLAVMRLDAALDIGGIYALRGGPYGKLGLPLSPNGANWDRFNGIAVSNAIKYVTPDWNGLSAGVMHAFGERPGAASRETGESAFLRYANGPFAAGAGYTRIRFPTVNAGQDGAAIAAAGARYQIGNWRLNGLYSSVRNTFTGAAVHAVELGAAGFYAPWVFGFSIERMQGNGGVDHAWANQLNLQGSYFLSKRTYVYLMAVLQRTNAGARATINTLAPSSGNQQGVYRLGVTTLF